MRGLAKPIFEKVSPTLSGSTFILYIMAISPMSSCICLPLNPLWLHLPANDNPSLERVCWYASPLIKLCHKNTEIRLTKTDRHGSDANGRQARWRRRAENKAKTGVKNSSFSVFSASSLVWPCLFKVTIVVFRDVFVNIRKYWNWWLKELLYCKAKIKITFQKVKSAFFLGFLWSNSHYSV